MFPLRRPASIKMITVASLLSLTLCLAILNAQTAPPRVPATVPAAMADSAPLQFDDFFIDKALRLEFHQTGDAKDEVVTLHGIYEEPLWPENPKSILPAFEGGHYAIKVCDAASNRLIFVKDFDTMYGEYKTTKPALDGVKQVFEKAVRIPEPKKPVRISFEHRDKKLVLSPEFTITLDPTDYHINRETVNLGDTIFEIQKTGEPHDRVDLVFLAEGYTAADKDKFKADAEKMTQYFFTMEPYKSNKDRFNIRAVFRASADRGTDEPRQKIYKSTVLDSQYNTFDLDRYLNTSADFAIHRMAAQVPYDTPVILVNGSRYGGGSICLDFCIASVDGPSAQRIFIHEFGHSFAALADEYVGDVAYNDMYPPGVEPLEPNITEMLDPANIKWKEFLTPGVALPTPAARGSTVVGAFEGAGYLSKGMYRPQMNCIMGNAAPPPNDVFCVVCQAGIGRMIDYYAVKPPAANPGGKGQP